MAKTNETPKRAQAPYVSFKTFLGLLRKLKETVVPEKIDADVLRQYPGSTARQVKAALRFLNLMDDNDHPLPALTTLVEALDAAAWNPAFQEVLTDAYSPIIGDLAIDRTTRMQLEARFREYQAGEKEVLDKVVSFYVSALVSAGVKVSPIILERAKPRSNGKTRARKSRDENDPNQAGISDETAAMHLPPIGTIRFTVPIPEKSTATMLLPPDLTVDDWDMVSTMVKAYITRRNKRGGQK